MTREAEINNYAYNNCISDDIDDTSYSLIVETARWADKTMIDKACEWMEENIDIYAKVVINPKSHYPEIVMCDSFEKSFKKTMEE